MKLNLGVFDFLHINYEQSVGHKKESSTFGPKKKLLAAKINFVTSDVPQNVGSLKSLPIYLEKFEFFALKLTNFHSHNLGFIHINFLTLANLHCPTV